jgi:hypothetical protein
MNFLKNNNSTINLPSSVHPAYNRHISLEIIVVQYSLMTSECNHIYLMVNIVIQNKGLQFHDFSENNDFQCS